MTRGPTPFSLSLDFALLAWQAQIVFLARLGQIATGSMSPRKMAGVVSEKVVAFEQAERAVIAAPDSSVATGRVIKIYQRRVSANLRRLPGSK